ITIGLFLQSFRLEISESISFLFITRDHTRTHKFLDVLQQTVKDCEEIFDPVEFCNKNREYLKSMSNQLLNGAPPRLQFYAHVFHRQKTSNWKGTLPFAGKKTEKFNKFLSRK